MSTSCLPNAYLRRHFDAIDLSTTPRTLPELTPVYLAFTLAPELATAASHSSSTFRAHPIQNAGDHFRSRFEPAQSDKCHVSPPPSHRTISIDNPVQATKRRGFVPNVSYVTELEIAKLADAFLVPKSDEWFVKECKNAVSHSHQSSSADSPRGQPPSQSRLSRTVISTPKASCSVPLLSGDRSREWC